MEVVMAAIVNNIVGMNLSYNPIRLRYNLYVFFWRRLYMKKMKERRTVH